MDAVILLLSDIRKWRETMPAIKYGVRGLGTMCSVYKAWGGGDNVRDCFTGVHVGGSLVKAQYRIF